MWSVLKNFLGVRTQAPPTPLRVDSDERTAWWSAVRRPLRPADRALTDAALRWLEVTPVHARPLMLAARHPRLVNRIAALRSDAAQTLDCLDALLVDERGGRAGFVPAIRAEIVRLRYLCSARLVESKGSNLWVQARAVRTESAGGLVTPTRRCETR